jgi:hypothetical protein
MVTVHPCGAQSVAPVAWPTPRSLPRPTTRPVAASTSRCAVRGRRRTHHPTFHELVGVPGARRNLAEQFDVGGLMDPLTWSPAVAPVLVRGGAAGPEGRRGVLVAAYADAWASSWALILEMDETPEHHRIGPHPQAFTRIGDGDAGKSTSYADRARLVDEFADQATPISCAAVCRSRCTSSRDARLRGDLCCSAEGGRAHQHHSRSARAQASLWL